MRAAAPYGDSSISQPTNYAMPGMATPGEVTEARRDDATLDENSVVGSRLNQISTGRDEPGRDNPDQGMERD